MEKNVERKSKGKVKKIQAKKSWARSSCKPFQKTDSKFKTTTISNLNEQEKKAFLATRPRNPGTG